MKDYALLSDENLIRLYREGDEEAQIFLLQKYKNLVRSKANMLFLVGGDTDDLIQEGMIGLHKAVCDFNPDRESSFFHFAEICVTRQMYTAIEASNRKKNAPLNFYVSLDSDTEGEDPFSGFLSQAAENDPEEMIMQREEIRSLLCRAQNILSPMEKKVFTCCLNGMTYLETAEFLRRTPKSVDNAIQRIKTKLRG